MKLKKLYQLLDDLTPGEQDHALEHLITLGADQADRMRRQYGLVMLADYHDEIEQRNRNWNQPHGLRTGLSALDDFTMGLASGELTVIGGATSQGKTLLACNIAANVAAAGHNVLFVTLEMTHDEIGSRLARIAGGLETIGASIALQKARRLDWQAIDGLIANAVETFGAQLVVIDHLHYFTRDMTNAAEELGKITGGLKDNALQHNIPLILISHTRKTERGQLTDIADLRGSSYIAQDADIVLMVGQRETDEGVLFVTLAKNRNRFRVQPASADATRPLLIDRDTLKLTDPGDGPFPGAVT